MDKNTKLVDLPTPKHLNSHHWTSEEIVFKRKLRVFSEIRELNIPLRSGLLYRLSKSVFGPFLKELNSKQCQDYILNENKLQILNWNLKRYNNHDMNLIREKNNFMKDYYELLQKAVNDCDVIDLHFLREYLRSLYLDCCFIKHMDNTLQKFEHLQILTLCGNFIKDIPGILLPRGLVYLELFDNFISDVSKFVRHAPKSIRYLGLGRNRLSDGSNLHLLAKSNNFTHLKCIDLSDNDICNLRTTLEHLATFSFLTGLFLEGNPCSILPEYKNEVVRRFPWLQYLDATEVLDKDKDLETTSKSIPQISFHCYRILGLPEPPKDKKNAQTIHIEVNFPLLVENPPEPEAEKPVENMDEQLPKEEGNQDSSKESDRKNKKGKDKKDKSKDKKGKKEKAEKKEKVPKKGKKKSYYAGENEYNKNLEERNFWFKTERKTWSKIIEFPSIQINDVEKSMTVIRDTFRSIVPVRIVYLKIAPYVAKPKKQKPKNKASKKDKKSKKQPKQEPGNPPPEVIEPVVEEPKETVLKKVTIASFYCELKSINWSDETLDFYWADHPDLGEKALRVNGSVRALDYDISASPKKAKKPPKAKEVPDDLKPTKEFLPSVFTCQVGFGLNRF